MPGHSNITKVFIIAIILISLLIILNSKALTGLFTLQEKLQPQSGGAPPLDCNSTITVTCCNIVNPGTYTLENDITDSGYNYCIGIGANNVTFDGQGHTIDGTDTGGTSGIVDVSITTPSLPSGFQASATFTVKNITVKNVTLTDWDCGVNYTNVQNGSISNVSASSNAYGIYLMTSSNGNTITNCTTNSNTNSGIYLNSSSNNNIFANNTASSNTNWDIYNFGVQNNTFTNQTLSSYPTTISFTYGGDISLKGVTSPPSDPGSYKNISKYINATDHPDEASPWLFLNVSYADSDISGVNESSLFVARNNGTWETNTSAFTDGTYGVNTGANYVYANITDFGSTFAPLGSLIPPISSCTIINSAGNYVLNQSILMSNLTCINIATSNVTLDCAGYDINYTTGGVSSISAVNAGIYTPRSYVTIKNCRVYNYSYGAYVANAQYNTLINNTFSNNSYGVYLTSSNNSIITNNSASSNTQYGINLENSNNNTISNSITSSNSIHDIYLSNAQNNTFTNQTIASYPTTVSFKAGMSAGASIGLKGVTSPPSDPSNYTNISKYVNASLYGSTLALPGSQQPGALLSGWLYLNVSYTHSEIGVIESSLRMSKNNGSWYTDPSAFANTYNVDTTNNYVYANITNFGSIFAPLGVPDNTPPTVDFVDPTPGNGTTISVNSVTINATVTDTQSNIDTCILEFNGVNETMAMIGAGSSVYCNTTKGNLSEGSYTYKVYANDTAGNMNVSETRIVTYTIPVGQAPPPQGGQGTTVQVITVNQLPTDGQDFDLGFGDSVDFTMSGAKHRVRLAGAFTGAAALEISSSPIRVTLAVGETQKIDLNGNGISDLEITLLSRSDNSARITLKPLPEVITPAPAPKPIIPTPVVQPPAPAQKAAFSTANILVVIVLAAVLASLAISRLKKKLKVPTPVSSIESYIMRELGRGHGEEHIKQRLLNVGWKAATIDEAFEKAKKS
jgi:parallel beta-helix repeat protein